MVHAQSPVEVGGYGGLTSSKTRTTDTAFSSEPHDSKRGLALGAYLRAPVHPGVLLEANLLYAQKGTHGGPNGTHTTHHYIELPLLARLDPLHAKPGPRFFAFGGLAPAIRVACTVRGPIFDNTTAMAVDYAGSCADLPGVLSEREPTVFDLSVVVGVGFGWERSFGTVELQARYDRGIIDTRDGDSATTDSRAFFVMAGVGPRAR